MDTRYWGLGIAAIAAVLAASFFDALRSLEASALAMGAPLVAVLLSASRLRESIRPIAIAGGVLALGVVLLAELEIHHTISPPSPIAQADVSVRDREATLAVPDTLKDFEVELHGALGHGQVSTSGSVTVEVSRGDRKETLHAEFLRAASAVQGGRRGTRGGGAHTFDTVRHDVQLAGSGPVHVELVEITGSIGNHVRVGLRRALPLGGRFVLLLGALVALAVVVELMASRRGQRMTFAAGLVFAGAFAIGVRLRYTTADPLGGVFSAILLAAIVGGVAALAVGGLSRWLRTSAT